MSFPFSAIITASGAVTFTSHDGASHTITRENPRYDAAKELLRQISDAVDDEAPLIDELVNIANPIKAIASDTGGRVFVKEGEVFFREEHGDATKVHNIVAERIVWMLSEGFDVKPMLMFLDYLMDNPSYRSVNDLYRFMERNQMGITPDGHLLAYKKVRSNFRDIHSGQFDNSPGQRPKMRRNEVEDNPNKTCSNGLHVCSFGYLPHFGSYGAGGDRVVVCKVNPRDVVSVPVDYQDAKMRVCEYLVLKEIKYVETGDILASRPVIDEEIDDHSDSEDRCPNCKTPIGVARYCETCGWEDDDDDDDDDDKDMEVVEDVSPSFPPTIEFLHGDKWQPMFGHGCATIEEAKHYVSALDPSGTRMRVRGIDGVVDQAPAASWPARDEDKAVDLRSAVSGVSEAANGLFGEKDVAVHMRLDGEGGLEVKLRPDKPNLLNDVKKIISEHLAVDLDKIDDGSYIMRDLGADSLDSIELIMAFEEHFSIEIRDEDFEKHSDLRVEEIVTWLQQHID